MLVGEIMTSPAVTVRDDATPQAAMRLLTWRFLPSSGTAVDQL
jgi:hypothetical protein